MTGWLKELWAQLPCLVAGHNGERQGGHREIFLRCSRCGRRSPGWQLPPAPIRRFGRRTEAIPYQVIDVAGLVDYLVRDEPDPVPDQPVIIHWDSTVWAVLDNRPIIH